MQAHSPAAARARRRDARPAADARRRAQALPCDVGAAAAAAGGGGAAVCRGKGAHHSPLVPPPPMMTVMTMALPRRLPPRPLWLLRPARTRCGATWPSGRRRATG
eukprot:251863-Chlamydomonas_euryale.AAC.8